MTSRARWIVGAVLLLGMAAACAQPPATAGRMDSLETRLVVSPDGGVAVSDVIEMTPDPSGRIVFHRAIGSSRSDAVLFQSASVDGQPVAPDGPIFTLSGEPGPEQTTMWRLDASTAPVSLGIAYAATAAVGVGEPRGRFEWPVLRPGRDFEIGDVTVTLDLPPGVHVYDGTGMAEAGWSVDVTDARVTAHRRGVGRDEAATLLAVFDIDTSRVQQGEWEWNLDRREQYLFALIAAGLFILVIGLGILAQLRVQYPPAGPDATSDERGAAAADRLMLSRGLYQAGAAGLVLAAASAVAAYRWLSGLGPAMQGIPASIAVVSLLFLIAAWWYRRSTRAAGRRT